MRRGCSYFCGIVEFNVVGIRSPKGARCRSGSGHNFSQGRSLNRAKWPARDLLPAFPMRPILALGVATAELVGHPGVLMTQPFAVEQFGDFLPCSASLTLFADEIHKWFEPTVEGSSAAGAASLHRLGIVNDVRIHQHPV